MICESPGARRVAIALAALCCFGALAVAASAETSVKRGQYLAGIMDCGGCHTYGTLAGRPDPARHLAGSDIGFAIPDLGVFYPPNLTSDPEHGLGSWSEADIVRAVRSGVRPDGRELAPAMPWRAYAVLSDEDAADLAAYIKNLPPVAFKAPGPFGAGESPSAPYLSVVAPK